MRTGVIAKKLGMSRYYNAEGVDIPVTMLKLDSCQVVSKKTVSKHGYNAVQLGSSAAKVKNVSKALKGVFALAKVLPKRRLAEFRVAENALLEPGQELCASHYVAGQFVDVVGTSIGKGFAGGMKRHNFRGLEETHGVSVSHRSHGSVGMCQDPGRIFKGKKMAGHLGAERVTIQNLEVIDIDVAQGIIFVCGAVPGAKGDFVLVSDAVKKALPAAAPYPAGIKSTAAVSSESSVAENDAATEAVDGQNITQENSDEN